MDFNKQPEMSRSSAKLLMTCSLCSQYFHDPRLLPCGHTFCRRCLQNYFDLKQSGLSIRIGRINCPKCKTMIGIPMSGVEGFPVDKEIGRIKDCVIDELAENISKTYHSHNQSDTLSSHSDRTDSRDIEEASDEASQKYSDLNQSRSRYAQSDATNSFYPNMAKYAKYFVKDDEKSSSEGYKPHFRPAVRAERHRVGYSSSFQHRRRRMNVEPPKGFDDASDMLRQSEYGSAPHVGRYSSSRVSSSYGDIFEQMPRSSEDLTTSHNLNSGISDNYSTTREHRYPGPSSKFPDDDFVEATGSMPSLSKIHVEHASGVDPGVVYSSMRNTFSKAKFNSSSGDGNTNFASNDGSDANSRRSWKVPEDTQQQNSDKTSSRLGSAGHQTHGSLHSSFMEIDPKQHYSNPNEKSRSNLPTHRENIVTSSSNENERPSQGVNYRDKLRSRSRVIPRPHSDYYSDRATFPHGEMKPEPSVNEKDSTNMTSSAHSFAPGSPPIRRLRIPKTSDGLHNECKAEEYQGREPLQRERVQSWYQDFGESKKFDENFTMKKPDFGESKKFDENFTMKKPDDNNISQNLKTEERSSMFHKSASFSTNHWQERVIRGDDDFKNGNFFPQLKRKTYLKNVNISFSTGNLNQFDGCIKFELKKGKNSKINLADEINDQNQDDSDDECESEKRQRNAFNERILNMRMDKYRYENIMSDFTNGNLCSETNLNDISDDVNCSDDVAEKAISESEVISQQSENMVEEDLAKKSQVSSTADLTNSENADTAPEKSDIANEKPVPEEVGHNLKEMIETMRAKYQAMDVDDQSSTLGSVVLRPSCSDVVVPKWNFQKTEFVIPTSIAITSKGCTVVADYGNSCLEFFDPEGNYEHSIDGVKPFSIAVNSLDRIIVGDRKGKAIRIFDEYGADVAQWESGLFGWISGLAVLPNGNVVIHDRDRCKIGIYSSGGEKIHEFASFGVHDSQLCMADFLTGDSKNRIIVADSGNHCLKIFDTNGTFISKIASRGTEDSCLEWPKGVCVDSMDNIIVADSQNNRISMFSGTGQFVQHLITTAPSPYSVCFSPSTRLLGVTHYAQTGFSQYDVYQCLQ